MKMRETDTAIYFLGGPFSQWHKAPFRGLLEPDGMLLVFSCAEQYMMASKALYFGDLATLDAIMATKDPNKQKQLGRIVYNFDEKKWDEVKTDIVFRGNWYRYGDSEEYRNALNASGSKLLVEGSSYDRIWGVGLDWSDPLIEDQKNWRGQNLLGRTHMAVREILNNLTERKKDNPIIEFNPWTATFQ